MSKSSLEIKELIIILVGSFNPVIFHPQWLVRKGLIREGEAEAAKPKINHPEISEFDLDYCSIQVLPHRFSITSTQEDGFVLMRDLVANIFESLPESHIVQLGINLHHHYKFPDKEEYIEFGHQIIPKEQLWGQVLTNPLLLKVNIQGERTDDNNGKIGVTVKTSDKINEYGVEIQINDHYNLLSKGEENKVDASRAVQILRKEWDNSLKHSEEILNKVYDYGISTD